MGKLAVRVTDEFEAELDRAAGMSGQTVSDFVRAALAEKLERARDERLADLSRKLSAQSLEVNHAFDGTLADGLND